MKVLEYGLSEVQKCGLSEVQKCGLSKVHENGLIKVQKQRLIVVQDYCLSNVRMPINNKVRVFGTFPHKLFADFDEIV